MGRSGVQKVVARSGARPGGPGRRIWRLAAQQHGVVTRRQLQELGLSAEAIDHRVRRRRLHPLLLGVYAVGRPLVDRRGELMAAVLRCGPGAVLSHRSASELWGLTGWEAPLEVTVPPSRNPRSGEIAIHRRDLPTDQLTRRDGIPVTRPLQTLLDLGAVLPAAELEAAVNAADRLNLMNPDKIRRALEGQRGRRGVAALRATLDARTFTLTDSELERRFPPLASKAGLEMPRTGAEPHGLRVDFYWPKLGLVVETDGLRYHRMPAQQARDRVRDQTHAVLGLTTLRFTHGQVVHQPDWVVDTLKKVARRLASGRVLGS